jgi:hypothetical protein
MLIVRSTNYILRKVLGSIRVQQHVRAAERLIAYVGAWNGIIERWVEWDHVECRWGHVGKAISENIYHAAMGGGLWRMRDRGQYVVLT